MASLKDDGTSMGRTYELGGPEIFTVHQLVIFRNHLIFCLDALHSVKKKAN